VSARISVAYVLTSYPPSVGGVQFLAHGVLKELAASQRQWVVSQWDNNRTDWLAGSTVFSPWRAAAYTIDGVAVRRLHFGLRDRLAMLPALPAFYLAPMLFTPWLARIFRSRIAPLLEGADLIHAYRVGRENLVGAALSEARRRGIPFVFTPTHHPRWVGYRYGVYLNIYREADGLIALTESERRVLVRLGVPEERICVTGTGPVLAPDADRDEFRRRHGLDDDPVVLFIGQKYAYKGVDLLLRAAPLVWEKHPDARFVFVGPRTSYSRKLFRDVVDPRILELDTVSLTDKTSAILGSTLVALPSSQESFGGVFTEAWSCRKPVIGGKIPAIESVIADGEDGLLTPHDGAELAERIMALLHDPGLCKQMGEKGYDKVQQHYSWEVLARKTREVYDSLL